LAPEYFFLPYLYTISRFSLTAEGKKLGITKEMANNFFKEIEREATQGLGKDKTLDNVSNAAQRCV
jgi:hypothetical protein